MGRLSRLDDPPRLSNEAGGPSFAPADHRVVYSAGVIIPVPVILEMDLGCRANVSAW